MDNAKQLVWVGSSLEDLKAFPKDVQREIGFVLYRTQIGKHHHSIKPLKGFSGVMEIAISHDKDAYRTVYAIKLGMKVYVLHAFKKKSKTGIKTPKRDIEIIRQRLQWARQLAKEDK